MTEIVVVPEMPDSYIHWLIAALLTVILYLFIGEW